MHFRSAMELTSVALLTLLCATEAQAACYLFGTAGDDYLVATNPNCDYKISGFAGNDTLVGNNGNDELFPGTHSTTGVDKMTGGAGTDAFIYDNVSYTLDSGDIITDFTHATDVIFMYGVCYYVSVTCTFIGSAPFDGAAGEVRYQTTSGVGVVQADLDGDKATDFTLILTGAPTVTSVDISFNVPPPSFLLDRPKKKN